MSDEVVVRKVRKNVRMKYNVILKEIEPIESTRGLGRLSSAIIPFDEDGQIQMAMRESMREYLEHENTPHGGRLGGSGSGSCLANQQTKLDRFYKSPPSVSKEPFDIVLARSRVQA